MKYHGSWPLIVFNVVFDISAMWATQNRVKTKIGQDLRINMFLFYNGTVC
jgi:hypothetical protein